MAFPCSSALGEAEAREGKAKSWSMRSQGLRKQGKGKRGPGSQKTDPLPWQVFPFQCQAICSVPTVTCRTLRWHGCLSPQP